MPRDIGSAKKKSQAILVGTTMVTTTYLFIRSTRHGEDWYYWDEVIPYVLTTFASNSVKEWLYYNDQLSMVLSYSMKEVASNPSLIVENLEAL